MSEMTRTTSPIADVYDVVVIGGGINGVGIAADAAGRGLSVLLAEKDDLASHTSSASSKLIHGGLRYLEHYEFRLVKESLAEREVLLAKAPHIVKPMRFILPHQPHLRSAWMIRVGLFLYDHLGRRKKLPGSKSLKFDAQSPLQTSMTNGFEYSDCWVDDARLVVLNALAARENGAHIHTQTRCVNAQRQNGVWNVNLTRADGSEFSVRSKALVNAAGPWVTKFILDDLKLATPYSIRLIQGSHIIVPRLYPNENAYILQNEDKRIVFTIPYLDQFTIIGTTDQEYLGDPAAIKITAPEIDYLLSVANRHFKKQLSANDILHTYSGARPLCNDESDNPSAITRDYTLSIASEDGKAPLLSVFGGKLTTYRKLAESAMTALKPYFSNMGQAWTAHAPLPGGEAMQDPAELTNRIRSQYNWLPAAIAKRWAITYGSRSWRLLENTKSIADLGICFSPDLYAREVDYLCDEEWAKCAEDILWRRTKLGLFLNAEQQRALSEYLDGTSIKSPLMSPESIIAN